MTTNPIWIAGYGGPVAGAAPVWIASYGAAVSGAAEAWIAGYGGTPSGGASPVWVAGYGGTPTGGASPIWIGGYVTSGGGALTPAQAYLARTVGGNEGGNAANITTLINGLVADGVWAKLDALYILAQQNQTDALLNLISTSYTATISGTPVFTSYQGFKSFDTGAGYLDTHFNGTTAPSPQFTLNSANMGVWTYLNSNASAGVDIGMDTSTDNILVSYGGNFYARINGTNASNIPTPGSTGLFTGDRSSSANVVPYWNGVSQGTQASASSAIVNANVTIGAVGVNETINRLSEAHVGASLGPALNLALYNRLRTYLTAVGVP